MMMTTAYLITIVGPAILFLLLGFTPIAVANRHVGRMRHFSVVVAGLGLALALLATAGRTIYGPLHVSAGWSALVDLGVYFDTLSTIMLLLITTLGWVIVRFTIRYLDGDPRQGEFIKWLCLTLGSVMFLVVCHNLVTYTATWMLTSFGLHRLLIHYGHRPKAIWAARKKFLISRIGDAFLIGTIVLTYIYFGSCNFDTVFARADALLGSGEWSSWIPAIIGTLLVFGAMTKSAQFPFHSWLPDTLETPTPVSALMHAGIINAGGFLILRLSPIVVLSPESLSLLAMGGAFTAIFAGLVMMTQTSIKKMLAYSTIAQMGFMMLECGLGAFTLAMVHLVAHSLYKAYAFLNSGSVIDEATALRGIPVSTPSKAGMGGRMAAALLLALPISAIAWVKFAASGAFLLNEAVLCLVMTLAIAQLMMDVLTSRSRLVFLSGVVAGVLVSLGYASLALLSKSLLPMPVVAPDGVGFLIHIAVMFVIAGVFVLLLGFQHFIRSHPDVSWTRELYVHAMNGFYCDIPIKRWTARLWGERMASP